MDAKTLREEIPDYSDVLKLYANHFEKSSSLFIRFEMPMPNSWSKERRRRFMLEFLVIYVRFT